MAERSALLRGRRARLAAIVPTVVLAVLAAAPTRAQEPEVIVLDPNRPLIQNPGTVPPSGPVPRTTKEPGEASPVLPLQEGVNAREVLADLWFKEEALQRRGEKEEAARQVEVALDFMQREGLRGAPEIAGAFLTRAWSRLDDGDYRGAQDQFRVAARFDPALGAAHTGLAIALLRGDRDLRGAGAELWTAMSIGLVNAGVVYQQAGNALLIVYLGFCLGAATALVLMCLRSAPALFHDLKERFPGTLSDDTSRLLGWGLLTLPLLALAPIVWLLTFWAILFYPYLRRAERSIAFLTLVLLVAAGPAGRLLDWVAGTAVDPGARALFRSMRGGYDLQDEQALKKLQVQHPDDPMFPFLLASIERVAGRFNEAMHLYEEVRRIDRSHSRALVNLANLHALRQEFAVAQGLYKQAWEADPTMAIAHYNSHLAHLEAFHLESADQELKEARRIDDALVTRLLAQGNEGRSRRLPADVRYAPGEIWKRAFTLRLDQGGRSSWTRTLGAPGTMAGGAGLALAFLWPGLGLAQRGWPARRCRRCGRAFCRRCQVVTKYPDHCSPCMHLFILRDGLAPNVKTRKMEEVVRHRRRVWVGERILSLALPGGGHVLGGRPLMGCLLLITWACAWMGLQLRDEFLVPSEGLISGGLLTVAAIGTVALIAWLVGNLTAHEADTE